jgi:hypothetical protein
MNKNLTIFENNGGMQYDKAAIKGTEIILKETGTGKPLFRGSNKVIVSGSEFNAIKDFDFDNYGCNTDFLYSIPSYDMAFAAASKPMAFYGNNAHPIATNAKSFAKAMSESSSDYLNYCNTSAFNAMADGFSGLVWDNENAQKIYQQFTRRVYLWCLGIDGCGVEASRVFKVINTKWIAPYGSQYKHYDDGTGGNNTYSNIETALIPFKYRTSDADLDETYRQQYFGRTLLNNGNSIGYFFKTFDESPALIRRYSDDSAGLDSVTDVWADNRAAEAEVVVQLKMSVSATDCREYFQKLTGINDSKVNTISLCTAVPYLRVSSGSDMVMDYFDIRPFTKFNFPNEALIDTSKGIDITYYLYY